MDKAIPSIVHQATTQGNESEQGQDTRRYVLVTAARNEADLIFQTIRSVISQVVKPKSWIIIDDGSTDQTCDVILDESRGHEWIKLIRMPHHTNHAFDSVVHALGVGIKAHDKVSFDYLGILDADIVLPENYYLKMMDIMNLNPGIGIAGGLVIDYGDTTPISPLNSREVPGAVQFIQNDCLKKLIPFSAIPEGGWDAITCLKARMSGYETRLIENLHCLHLKPRNVSQGGQLKRKWQMGVRDHALGYDPLFELGKCMRRLMQKPRVLGSFSWFLGYLYSMARFRPRHISREMVEFLRIEQRARMIEFILPR